MDFFSECDFYPRLSPEKAEGSSQVAKISTREAASASISLPPRPADALTLKEGAARNLTRDNPKNYGLACDNPKLGIACTLARRYAFRMVVFFVS